MVDAGEMTPYEPPETLAVMLETARAEEEVCARNEYLEKVEDGYELPQAISIAVKLRHGGPLIHQQRPPAAPCHSCVLAILCAYIYVLCYY